MIVKIVFDSGLSQLSSFNGSQEINLLLGSVFKGLPGEDGDPGSDGKSAFILAQEAGYKGTEQELSKALANLVSVEILEQIND